MKEPLSDDVLDWWYAAAREMRRKKEDPNDERIGGEVMSMIEEIRWHRAEERTREFLAEQVRKEN